MLTKALFVEVDTGPQKQSISVNFRYMAGERDQRLSEVCNLHLPCDNHGLISPDAVHMLIAYLTRLVSPTDVPRKDKD